MGRECLLKGRGLRVLAHYWFSRTQNRCSVDIMHKRGINEGIMMTSQSCTQPWVNSGGSELGKREAIEVAIEVDIPQKEQVDGLLGHCCTSSSQFRARKKEGLSLWMGMDGVGRGFWAGLIM